MDGPPQSGQCFDIILLVLAREKGVHANRYFVRIHECSDHKTTRKWFGNCLVIPIDSPSPVISQNVQQLKIEKIN